MLERVDNLLNDHLAGCRLTEYEDGSYHTLLESLLLRIRLLVGKKQMLSLHTIIADQAVGMICGEQEYVINELLYHVREGARAFDQHIPDEETIVRQWCNILLARGLSMDRILDFVSDLKRYRTERKS